MDPVAVKTLFSAREFYVEQFLKLDCESKETIDNKKIELVFYAIIKYRFSYEKIPKTYSKNIESLSPDFDFGHDGEHPSDKNNKFWEAVLWPYSSFKESPFSESAYDEMNTLVIQISLWLGNYKIFTAFAKFIFRQRLKYHARLPERLPVVTARDASNRTFLWNLFKGKSKTNQCKVFKSKSNRYYLQSDDDDIEEMDANAWKLEDLFQTRNEISITNLLGVGGAGAVVPYDRTLTTVLKVIVKSDIKLRNPEFELRIQTDIEHQLFEAAFISAIQGTICEPEKSLCPTISSSKAAGCQFMQTIHSVLQSIFEKTSDTTSKNKPYPIHAINLVDDMNILELDHGILLPQVSSFVTINSIPSYVLSMPYYETSLYEYLRYDR